MFSCSQGHSLVLCRFHRASKRGGVARSGPGAAGCGSSQRHAPVDGIRDLRSGHRVVSTLDRACFAGCWRVATSPLLPQRRFAGRARSYLVGEIPVHDSACADVEYHEDTQPLKGRGHDDEEVAGEHDAGMIMEERCP
jgi:hypothetical protein